MHDLISIIFVVELGVIIGQAGRNIPALHAFQHVGGYVLALDMTARNIQADAKSKGQPWTVAKGYDTFAPLGKFIQKDDISNPDKLNLMLKVL